MSVLIKGLDMPKCCIECWNCDNFNDRDLGDIDDWMCLIQMKFVEETGENGRPDWCPLVEVVCSDWDKPMTNREWLFTLSNERLAYTILYEIPKMGLGWSTSNGWLMQWLNEEHKESEK